MQHTANARCRFSAFAAAIFGWRCASAVSSGSIYGYLTSTDCRGHKIDGTKPNQTGNTFADKQGKQTEQNGQKSSQQRTSSHRGLKIDGTKPNQTGYKFGDKRRKQTEENGHESSQQRTSSR